MTKKSETMNELENNRDKIKAIINDFIEYIHKYHDDFSKSINDRLIDNKEQEFNKEGKKLILNFFYELKNMNPISDEVSMNINRIDKKYCQYDYILSGRIGMYVENLLIVKKSILHNRYYCAIFRLIDILQAYDCLNEKLYYNLISLNLKTYTNKDNDILNIQYKSSEVNAYDLYLASSMKIFKMLKMKTFETIKYKESEFETKLIEETKENKIMILEYLIEILKNDIKYSYTYRVRESQDLILREQAIFLEKDFKNIEVSDMYWINKTLDTTRGRVLDYRLAFIYLIESHINSL